MSPTYRHAMCNEAFGETPFPEQCRTLREAGYQGIELAPFTLAADPLTISPAQRAEYRRVMLGEQLSFVGLHWLMVSDGGFHLTTPDDSLRARSWQRIRDLIDLSADLGDDTVMIFGSPKQRSSTGGATPAKATRNFTQGFRDVAQQAGDRGVTLLVETLGKSQSDIVNTISEAARIVAEVAHPAVQTMFDVHNTESETEAHVDLIERYLPVIRHVHVQEMDGRYPGTGTYDFRTLLAKLTELKYAGWVSLEAFDFSPGAGEIARNSLHYLHENE